MTAWPQEILATQRGAIGVITLHRPQALNALSLGMVREITRLLRLWRDDASVAAVLLRGSEREGKPPAFCAGGDIRAFHRAALDGDPMLEDFFTEEYALDHLVHRYPKPVIAFLDGVTMGGGMGLAQGAALRIVTEHSQLAMPETLIGFFPDVGGGWFLSRCPGRLGEYQALTGQVLAAADAMAAGLADVCVPSASLPLLLEALCDQPHENLAQMRALMAAHEVTAPSAPDDLMSHREAIDHHFAAPTLAAVIAGLQADTSAWAQATLATLGKRSPLMMAVALEQIRRARSMSLADALRMERGMVRHCFQPRPGAASETVEGIRALVIDRDHRPHWNPPRVDQLTPGMVQAFFDSPWPAHAHPLRDLA